MFMSPEYIKSGDDGIQPGLNKFELMISSILIWGVFFIGSFTKLFHANSFQFPDGDVEKTSSTCLENIKFFCQSRLKCSGIFIGNSEVVPTLILRWRFPFHFFEPRFHFQDGNHDGISLCTDVLFSDFVFSNKARILLYIHRPPLLLIVFPFLFTFLRQQCFGLIVPIENWLAKNEVSCFVIPLLLFAKEKKRFWLNICKCGFIPKNIFNILVKLTKNNIPYQECVCFFY